MYPSHLPSPSLTSHYTTLAVFSLLTDTFPDPVISWGGSNLFVAGSIANTHLYEPRVVGMHVVACLTDYSVRDDSKQLLDIGDTRYAYCWS